MKEMSLEKEEDSDLLTPQEREAVSMLQTRLQAGDDSEFENWETVKAELMNLEN
jgi:hypothetical protein